MIAIIGGVGSGKSSALAHLKKRGFRVISTDAENQKLLKNPNYIKKITTICPKAVKNSAIDKDFLRKQIFKDSELRKNIEKIAHPLITEAVSGFDIVEVTAPTKENLKNFERIIYIKTSESLRVARATKKISDIIKAQPTAAEYAEMATDIVENDGTLEELFKKLDEKI